MASIRMACSHLALSYVSTRLYTLVRWRKRLETMRVARHSNQLVETSYRVVNCRRPQTPQLLLFIAPGGCRGEKGRRQLTCYSPFVVQWDFIRSFRNAPDNFSGLRPACKKASYYHQGPEQGSNRLVWKLSVSLSYRTNCGCSSAASRRFVSPVRWLFLSASVDLTRILSPVSAVGSHSWPVLEIGHAAHQSQNASFCQKLADAVRTLASNMQPDSC